ncbi:MAG: hypothetical protein HY821_25140 [Acidobacteria bacterium]|nr:hypothetical protein [Acidobacteriota bacterium]
MSSRKPVGLIASGRLADSALVRLPGLCRELGPVAAASLRLASRYANTLKCGRPAAAAEFEDCRMVAIQAAAEDMRGVIRLLRTAGVDWGGKPVVLLNDDLDASALSELGREGALTCAAAVAPGPGVPLVLAEGDAGAVRAVRDWAQRARARCVELNAGTKLSYGAGVMAANSLITPILEAALRSFRAAGLGLTDSRRILAYLAGAAIRSHQAHGRKGWVNPALPARQPAIRAQLKALGALDPELARFHMQVLRCSLHLLGQAGDWLEPPSANDSSDLDSPARIK